MSPAPYYDNASRAEEMRKLSTKKAELDAELKRINARLSSADGDERTELRERITTLREEIRLIEDDMRR